MIHGFVPEWSHWFDGTVLRLVAELGAVTMATELLVLRDGGRLVPTGEMVGHESRTDLALDDLVGSARGEMLGHGSRTDLAMAAPLASALALARPRERS